MLTGKQEKFARLVAEGKEQSGAYREAYNASNMKPETIHKRASELALSGAVKGRIDTLKKEFTEKLNLSSTITVETLLKDYQEIENLAKNPIHGKDNNSYDLANWVKVKQEMTKLLGLYAPTKAENTNIQLTPQDLLKKLDEDSK